ncbi:AMIN domain-containing protein [Desulfovibrio sp. JC022]|uniref:AMIN domain-containing protein n=1 Tax=Desulfovibrio sp. JC022 TaxID=2593642 RepID=UPI0013D0E837|nr:AMIN domain-containing protein [Desulfovibrio sp. JC022]NDV22429.1 AMIN domain-containing protein [Desulfovibrio sp. JC022]
MKIKFRPFTLLLLIILLVVGVNAVLFHMGFFDSFLAGKEQEAVSQNGEGPVVRREISKLVLPLESAKPETSELAEGLNEADISAANQSDTQGATPVVKDEELHEADQVSAAAKPEVKSKPAQAKSAAKKAAAKPSKTSASKGVLGNVSVACKPGKASIEVVLSASAGKISWFNLAKPRRLVVDLHGKWQNKAKSLYRLKDCPLRKIVLGEHPDKIRLVFYLDKKGVPAKIKPTVRKHDKGVSLGLGF